MSRWRPPGERSSPYITLQGYQNLERELATLWSKRRIVNDALSAAAAEGDRSENAEYIYRKKEQAGIDRRIRYIQKRLPDLKVVSSIASKDRVFFGAWVTVSLNNAATEYRIVGADEADSLNNLISVDSPLARALLKKAVDDEFKVNVQGTESIGYIEAIRY